MGVVISRGSIKDLAEIVDLNKTIFDGMYSWDPYGLDHYVSVLTGFEPLIYIARHDGSLIGNSISFPREDNLYACNLYVWILGVAQEFRRRDIGNRLMDRNEIFARQNNHDMVTAKVYKVSTAMQRFLLKRGYHTLKIDEAEDSRYDAIHFGLKL